MSLPVAVADSAPAYRRGLSLSLERAGFAPVEEPGDPVVWAAAGGCRALLLTVRSASDWEPARCLAESNPELILVVLLAVVFGVASCAAVMVWRQGRGW